MMRTPSKILGLVGIFVIVTSIVYYAVASPKPKKNPYIDETEGQRTLILPSELDEFLSVEFPGYKIPDENIFNPDMLAYYNSRLIGIHPAIAWGDFNGDRKSDYAMLVITSQSKWGPVIELVVLNKVGGKESFQPFRLGEIYDVKDDYVSFSNGKLMKGRYKKGAWFIHWDKKKETYVVNKA